MASSDRRNEPITPDHALRNRWTSSPGHENITPHSGYVEPLSPTSSSTASTGSIPRIYDTRSALRSGLSTTSMGVISLSTPTRKLVIRSDPSLVTSFDTADKELYDLWAPKLC